MIISDKHRYLFVELPRTATTAIAKELRENYEGHSILYKHATYEDFLRIATDEQKKYFTFSCIRNPLDDVVSIYLKYRHNHGNSFTNPNNLKRRDPFLRFFDRILRQSCQETHRRERTLGETPLMLCEARRRYRCIDSAT